MASFTALVASDFFHADSNVAACRDCLVECGQEMMRHPTSEPLRQRSGVAFGDSIQDSPYFCFGLNAYDIRNTNTQQWIFWVRAIWLTVAVMLFSLRVVSAFDLLDRAGREFWHDNILLEGTLGIGQYEHGEGRDSSRA